MNFHKKLPWLFLLFASHILHAEPLKGVKTTEPLVAVGSYTAAEHFSSLIIASDNGGADWSFVPAPSAAYMLTRVACTGNQCTALGTTGEGFPAIYSSNDIKHAWQVNKAIAGLPSEMQYARLTDLSCVANTCVAVGDYSIASKGQHKFPLLLRSEDSGNTWNVSEVTNFRDNASDLALKISCSGSTCVVAGQFTMGSSPNSIPRYVLLVSRDAGRTWDNIEKIKGAPGLASLNNVSCDGASCAAVGLYLSDWPHATKPFIVYSSDEGKSWAVTTSVMGLTPAVAELGSWMRFTMVNCKDKICIAGGMRLDVLPNYFSNKPLLLMSRDSGKTWGYVPVRISSFNPSGVSVIDSLNCAGTHCVAMGQYEKSNERSSFILSSKNSGISWEVIKAIPGTPADFMQQHSLFKSMNCADKLCVIVGEHLDEELTNSYAFFLTSHDSGMTWEFKKDIALLPEAQRVSLESISGSQNNIPVRSGRLFDREKELLKMLK